MTREADPLDRGTDLARPGARSSDVDAVSCTRSFEAVYESHYRDVYRYVLALVRDRDEADEVVALAFERAYRSWIEGRQAEDRALPWLLLTARRIAIDRWRRARRMLRHDGVGRSAGDGTADEARTEFWAWFEALARALSERQREVLVLRYRGDLSDEEIGAIMRLTPSGVRSLVARALAALRAHPELLR